MNREQAKKISRLNKEIETLEHAIRYFSNGKLYNDSRHDNILGYSVEPLSDGVRHTLIQSIRIALEGELGLRLDYLKDITI